MLLYASDYNYILKISCSKTNRLPSKYDVNIGK